MAITRNLTVAFDVLTREPFFSPSLLECLLPPESRARLRAARGDWKGAIDIRVEAAKEELDRMHSRARVRLGIADRLVTVHGVMRLVDYRETVEILDGE